MVIYVVDVAIWLLDWFNNGGPSVVHRVILIGNEIEFYYSMNSWTFRRVIILIVLFRFNYRLYIQSAYFFNVRSIIFFFFAPFFECLYLFIIHPECKSSSKAKHVASALSNVKHFLWQCVFLFNYCSSSTKKKEKKENNNSNNWETKCAREEMEDNTIKRRPP